DLTEQIAEHFPKEDKKSWFNRYDYDKRGRLLVRIQNARRIMARQTASKLATNSLSSSEEADDDDSKAIQAWLKSHKFENFSEIIDLWEDTMKYRCWQTKHLKDIQSMREFLNNWPSYKLETGHELTLENIIPEVFNKCKEIYKKNKILSAKDRRLLTNSIVYYFESRNWKFTMNTMDSLAEQIVEHFPTEDKNSWFNRGGDGGRGRIYIRHRSTRNWDNIKPNVSKSTINEPILNESQEEAYDESKSIQAWLKANNCENFSEIIDLWEDTMKYRCLQTQNLKDLKSILEFLNNWPSYKLETGHELIPGSCILIYLVHAITKPLRPYKTANGTVRYAITDSQQSMTRLIDDYTDVDLYMNTEPCIYVVGDSLLDVKECFVVFADLRYKLSYENCLA
ncbi:hypothetical protein DOY81_013870, partial [Sarcophaga bullata]